MAGIEPPGDEFAGLLPAQTSFGYPANTPQGRAERWATLVLAYTVTAQDERAAHAKQMMMDADPQRYIPIALAVWTFEANALTPMDRASLEADLVQAQWEVAQDPTSQQAAAGLWGMRITMAILDKDEQALRENVLDLLCIPLEEARRRIECYLLAMAGVYADNRQAGAALN